MRLPVCGVFACVCVGLRDGITVIAALRLHQFRGEEAESPDAGGLGGWEAGGLGGWEARRLGGREARRMGVRLEGRDQLQQSEQQQVSNESWVEALLF